MKKNPENQTFVKLGITGAVVVLIGLGTAQLLAQGKLILKTLSAVGAILTPFLYGFIIAYLLAPLCNCFEKLLGRVSGRRKGIVTGLSILLSLLLAFLLIVLLLMLVIPNLIGSILQIADELPAQMEAFAARAHVLLQENKELQEMWDSAAGSLEEGVSAWLDTELSPTIQKLISSLGAQLLGIVNLLFNLFLGILISVYMLASRRKFALQARLLLCGAVPKKWADLIEEEVHYADRMFHGFLMGRILDAVIVGVICFVFTSLCGFESAVLISVMVGVTNTIPMFGPFLGAIPSALLLLLENPLHCLIFLIFIVILQQIDGNIIGPRVVGQKTGISSFWVLFSVLLFGGLWGIVGMIIGVPLFAVLYDIVRKLVYAGLRHWKREDLLQ